MRNKEFMRVKLNPVTSLVLAPNTDPINISYESMGPEGIELTLVSSTTFFAAVISKRTDVLLDPGLLTSKPIHNGEGNGHTKDDAGSG
jgi:hypothetical protein